MQYSVPNPQNSFLSFLLFGGQELLPTRTPAAMTTLDSLINRPEEMLLAMTKQRKVWGVGKLWDNQDIDSIASLRRALRDNTTEGTLDNQVFF